MEQPIQTIDQVRILTASLPGFKQRLAASELQRGLLQLGYARRLVIGELPGPTPEKDELRIVLATDHARDDERYTISTGEQTADAAGITITIHGASEQALLYGIFAFLERQGAFFGLDGDLYPLDAPPALHLPEPERPWSEAPHFTTRGLQPWPDFLNCLTVFNRQDYRAYLEAMLRMRFNMLGIHVYGQNNKWAESFLSFEYGGVGHAAFTDTTATDRWGYLPQRTSRYGLGASQYFDEEIFGSDATRHARGPWEAAEMAQQLWREAFTYAERLGIRTGVGFEPYQLPDEIMRACPAEVQLTRRYQVHDKERTFTWLDPESRTAQTILETRLSQLLEAYPSVNYVYLWEDEHTNWASQHGQVEISVTPFKQAYDFLRRHAPDKRLVVAGWGGVARNFMAFHRALPEDVIFTCLSDQFGWDPVHEAFGKLEGRERWPILWVEDDPSMWFPQLHVNRFARDMAQAERYGCQGILGIHWRHRIIDPVAGYLSRRSWEQDVTPKALFTTYARTQAAGERAETFASLLADADANRRLLETWTGEVRPDGHIAFQELSGDYSEAFLYRSDLYPDIPDATQQAQQEVITQLGSLLAEAESAIERGRLGYWYGQTAFLDPYAQAWRAGAHLQRLLSEQYERKRRGEGAAATTVVREQGVPLWIEVLGHVRTAVLAFQQTVATRNDLGMLASIHNKFVRIATYRLQALLLEFLDALPSEAEAALAETLAPDDTLEGRVFVPTRPTRLLPVEKMVITAVAPGLLEPSSLKLCWRYLEATGWQFVPMQLVGRRTYSAELSMPPDASGGIAYYVEATFTRAPHPLVVTAPNAGAQNPYLVTL